MLGEEGASAAAAGPVDYASGAFLAFLHNLSPAQEPVACVPPTPTRTQTPAYCCAPSGHGRRGASTARTRCLSHSASSQPNPGPPLTPWLPRERKRVEGGRGAPTPGKGTRAASGVPQLRFYSRQGEEDAAARTAGAARGWELEGTGTHAARRGAHWAERGRRDPQERGTRGPHGAGSRDVRARGGRRSGGQDLGRRDGQTAPKAGEGGRLGVLGAQGGVPGGRERGNLRAEVQGDSAWCSSSGLGALDPKRPTWVEGHARPSEGERRRVIHREKQMEVKLVRLPGGGEQAGECGQEHEAGQESRGGCEAVGTE